MHENNHKNVFVPKKKHSLNHKNKITQTIRRLADNAAVAYWHYMPCGYQRMTEGPTDRPSTRPPNVCSLLLG